MSLLTLEGGISQIRSESFGEGVLNVHPIHSARRRLVLPNDSKCKCYARKQRQCAIAGSVEDTPPSRHMTEAAQILTPHQQTFNALLNGADSTTGLDHYDGVAWVPGICADYDLIPH